MPKPIKEKSPLSLLSILLILPIFLWLNKDSTERYWNVLKFKIRNTPMMKEGKCITVGNMFALSPKSNIDTKFLEKDFPNLLQKDEPLSTKLPKNNRPKKDYPWSEYKIKMIAIAPGGYVLAEVSEYKRYPPNQMGVIHRAVYQKNSAGEYSQIEDCLKAMG